jgi:hypothetical protein
MFVARSSESRVLYLRKSHMSSPVWKTEFRNWDYYVSVIYIN